MPSSGSGILYRQVLGQVSFDVGMRRKHTGKLPEVYSQDELVRLCDATVNLQQRVLLMSTYAAGVRLSEVTHLREVLPILQVDSLDEGFAQVAWARRLSPEEIKKPHDPSPAHKAER